MRKLASARSLPARVPCSAVLAPAFALLLAAAPPGAAAGELSPDRISERATLAAQYLSLAQLPEGRFGYEYDFLLARFLDRDNMVRQAGAGSILAEYFSLSGDRSLAKPAERAVRFYQAKSIPFGSGSMVSRGPGLSGATTGGTALALLAELAYSEATGDERFAETRRAWLAALIALQRPSGGFAQSPANDEESPYYNGEAWLALAHYHGRFPDDAAAAAALQGADSYLVGRYVSAPDIGFVHWGLMAAAIRHDATGDPRFLDFIERSSEGFMTRLRPRLVEDANSCSMVEGLAAGARALKAGGRGSGALFDAIIGRIDAELAKDLDLQIAPGQRRLALGGGRYLEDPVLPHFAGAFLNGRYLHRARVDFTQHCLSALMKYQALVALSP